jgi:hypothetical protein
VVLTYGHSQKRQWVALTLLSFVLLWACTALESEEEANIMDPAPSYVSADLWLDNAKNLISQLERTPASKVFMAEMSGERGILEITLNNDNEVLHVLLEGPTGTQKRFFFERGRLAFSEVQLSSEISVVSAYADQKPYAHAFPDGSHPEDWLVESMGLYPGTLSELTRIAKEYSRKEKNADYDHRIQGLTASITDSLNADSEFLAILNVIKGERIRIDLSSSEPHVYFTISPNNGSDMEHTFWQGEAPITGDMAIRVFAAEMIRNGAFSLTIERR